MLTKDPVLMKWFDHTGQPCDRVFGFYFGYNCIHGKGKDFLATKDYKLGWDEGKDLRFDEMKTAHRRFMQR